MYKLSHWNAKGSLTQSQVVYDLNHTLDVLIRELSMVRLIDQ